MQAWIVTLLQLAIGTLFSFSGLIKMFDLKAFSVIVRQYGLLPRRLVKPLAYAQPFIETGAGLWILSNWQLRWASLAGLVMILIATVFVLAGLIQKKKIENCGCYGALVKIPLTWKKFWENTLWTALAALLAWSQWQ